MDTVDTINFLLDSDPNVKLQKLNGLSLLHLACREYNDSNIEAGIQVIKAIYDAHPEAIEGDEMVSDHDYHQQVKTFINNQLVYASQAEDHRQMTTPDEMGQLPLHTVLQNNVTLGSVKLLLKGNPPALQTRDNSGTFPCTSHVSITILLPLCSTWLSLTQQLLALWMVKEIQSSILHVAVQSMKR